MKLEKGLIKKMLEEQNNKRKIWTEKDKQILEALLDQKINNPKIIKKYGFFKNRSVEAVRCMIRRINDGRDIDE